MPLTRLEQDAQSRCASLMSARSACWVEHGGRDTEACLKQELLEKRCIAAVVCKSEAELYYGASVESKGTCSLWAEHFAWRGEAEHERGRAAVQSSPALTRQCTRATQGLAGCLAQSAAALYAPT